jgi:hypothetical protein
MQVSSAVQALEHGIGAPHGLFKNPLHCFAGHVGGRHVQKPLLQISVVALQAALQTTNWPQGFVTCPEHCLVPHLGAEQSSHKFELLQNRVEIPQSQSRTREQVSRTNPQVRRSQNELQIQSHATGSQVSLGWHVRTTAKKPGLLRLDS